MASNLGSPGTVGLFIKPGSSSSPPQKPVCNFRIDNEHGLWWISVDRGLWGLWTVGSMDCWDYGLVGFSFS